VGEDQERAGGRYPSTLPLDDLARELSSRSLPWAWSDDAGGFLCNHVFYRARAWVEQAGLQIPCGFIHLPPLEALPLPRQLEAVTSCLALIDTDRTRSGTREDTA
jgi:pyrrolidone-carboxylate peptidase